MYSLEIQKEVLDKDNNNSFEKMTPGTFNLTKNKIVDVKLFLLTPPTSSVVSSIQNPIRSTRKWKFVGVGMGNSCLA